MRGRLGWREKGGTPGGAVGPPTGERKEERWTVERRREAACCGRGRRVGKHGFINLWFVCLSCEVDGLDGLIKSQSVKPVYLHSKLLGQCAVR